MNSLDYPIVIVNAAMFRLPTSLADRMIHDCPGADWDRTSATANFIIAVGSLMTREIGISPVARLPSGH